MTSPPDAGGIRRSLHAMRDAAAQQLAGLETSFEDIVQAASGVATDDEHDPEGHTIAWERQQVAALLSETRAALERIEAAEQRLDAGVYGICTSCGDEIAPERLEALPATPTCVDCAS